MTTDSLKILLVDDDKFLLDMYALKFTAAQFEVRAVLSVSEAVDVLRTGFSPSAVVFDLLMPGEDGFELLRIIRTEKLAREAVLIALTNQSSESDRAAAEKLGADRYVIKAEMIPSEVVGVVGEEIEARKKTHKGVD